MGGYIRASLRLFDLRQWFIMSRSLRSPQGGRTTRDPGRVGLRVARGTLLLAVVLAVTTTCATYRLYSDCVAPSSPCPEQVLEDQEAVLFLVGDAGNQEFDRNPVLQHMKTAVTALDERGVPTTVVFLGDNVYDEGVREGDAEDLRLLGAQVEVVAGTSGRAIFLAGNHDWANSGNAEGLERLINQERALGVFSENGADVGLRPQAGCPGPVRENLVDSRGNILAALVLLDTPWWMLEPPTAPRCRQSTKEDVMRGVERLLSEASDIPVIVAAHHPVKTGGPHGGNTGFPRWLANRVGLLREDLNASHYRVFIERLSGVFRRASRPIIYVAGHEHSLQVIEESLDGTSVLHLVSGSGSKVTGTRPIDGSRFSAGLPGYMRLDFRSNGRIQLDVLAECLVGAVEANLCRGVEAGRFQSVYRARVR